MRLLPSLLGLSLTLVCGGSAAAQNSDPVLDLLVRKGLVTADEAAELRQELAQAPAAEAVEASAGGKATTRLSLAGRIQGQYVGLETDIDGAADPASVQHFLLRRVYLTAKAELGAQWRAVLTYDFASNGFDEAVVKWEGDDLTVDLGLRKVNTVYEERLSSSGVKPIERSAVTRYFVEPNNGRRLGAASYRVGVFVDGGKGPFHYGVAVTNPERAEDFSSASGAGDGSNNRPAFWANAGWEHEVGQTTLQAGVGFGWLPEQGGPGAGGRGQGHDLAIYSAHLDASHGPFGLLAQVVAASVDAGAAAGVDASPFGVSLQPSVYVTETLELVGRYSYLHTDGRGVSLSDGVRSAPGGGTMDELTELYLGANWYVKKKDLMFQLGYVWGRTEDQLNGQPAEATTQGARSQVQLQF